LAVDDRRATAALILLTGAIVAAAAWLLASPGLVVSREMTWDLLFNLGGAWHLHNSHAAHVDFHDPVGQLYFRLTQLGFLLCGTTVFAVIPGKIAFGAFVFVCAVTASVPRLPPVAAAVFILFTSLLALMPVNVGDGTTDFSFAMSYNTYGWAALSVLSLILFMPGRKGDRHVDAVLGALLMVALYYLKISYFLAALAELAVAVVLCRHVRSPAWLAMGALVILNAVAPYNWAYLADIRATVQGGAADVPPAHLRFLVRINALELSLYVAATVVALGLWLRGRASPHLPIAAALLTVMSFVLLALNTQIRGLPLGMVILFLLYDALRPRWAALALLAFPLALAVQASASVIGYHQAASGLSGLFVVDRTNLSGLAVPDDAPIRPGEEVSQGAYVRAILEAATLLERAKGGIVLLDQVNPMPFVLGRPPQRGAPQWLATDFPWPSAEAMFAGADNVLIPKSPTHAAVTSKAIELYGPYMAQHFPVRRESASWIVLNRGP
jgi:hypothetical protein